MDRESMLAVRPKTEPLDVPEWGGTVYVRQLNGAELVAWSEASTDAPTAEKGTGLLVRCLVDAAGVRLFKEEDAAALVELPGGLVNRLCGVANDVNGLTEKAKASAEKK
jgi:hypothetical protein